MKAKIGQLVHLVPYCDAKDHSHTTRMMPKHIKHKSFIYGRLAVV